MDKQKIKQIANIVVNVLIWILVILSIIVTLLVFAAQGSDDGIPDLFGTSLITVETGSMRPVYNEGDLVFMKKISDEDKYNLKKGDIITFRTSVDINGDGVNGDINTHRIHEPVEGTLTFITKGDYNPAPDNVGDTPYTVHHADIIGVCTEDGKIAGLGAVINFLRSSLGFFLCIVLPLILFFLYELYNFIALLISERTKKAPVSKETEEEIKRRAIEEYLKSQGMSQNTPEKTDDVAATDSVKETAVPENNDENNAKEEDSQNAE